MKTRDSWKCAVIGFAVICLVLPAAIFAQDKPAKTFKPEELEQLLAPIALHPDNVLTQILIASTYPLEVVQADRWVKQNKSLKGDAMKAALEKQPWDASVKALAPFPDVLAKMSEKLEWTQKVGDAFLGQQKEVMDTVQKLRRKAAETGNLKTTKEQEVKKEGDIIIIQAANPQVIYVPTYNPTVVYGTWPYPAYPPYPVYAYPPGAAAFTFAMGVAVGAAWHGAAYHNNWQGGTINIDNSVNINRSGTQPAGGGAKAEQWQHNPEHRQGVPYSNTATQNKYSQTNRAAAESRQGNRGYDTPGAGTADRTASGQSAQAQDRKAGQSGSQAKSGNDAFGGMDRGGAQVSQESARGGKSTASAESRGGGSSRSSGGGGRGRR